MLPTLVYVIDAIRRALQKARRGMFMLADSFVEGQEFRRTMRAKYRYMEE